MVPDDKTLSRTRHAAQLCPCRPARAGRPLTARDVPRFHGEFGLSSVEKEGGTGVLRFPRVSPELLVPASPTRRRPCARFLRVEGTIPVVASAGCSRCPDGGSYVVEPTRRPWRT